MLCFTSLQRDALKCPERLLGSIGVSYPAEIDLNHLVTCALATVSNLDGQLAVFVLRLAKSKRSITQAITKRPEWLPFEITVGAVGHGVVKEIGKVLHRAVEGDRQFTRWVVITKEYISYRISTSLSWIPGLNNGLTVLHLRHQSNS